MNDKLETALKNADDIGLLTIQITVLSFAVEALIATHPNPSEIRRVFDQMFSQFQASPAMLGASPDAALIARRLIEKLFQKTQ